jgi:hypothetical protein
MNLRLLIEQVTVVLCWYVSTSLVLGCAGEGYEELAKKGQAMCSLCNSSISLAEHSLKNHFSKNKEHQQRVADLMQLFEATDKQQLATENDNNDTDNESALKPVKQAAEPVAKVKKAKASKSAPTDENETATGSADNQEGVAAASEAKATKTTTSSTDPAFVLAKKARFPYLDTGAGFEELAMTGQGRCTLCDKSVPLNIESLRYHFERSTQHKTKAAEHAAAGADGPANAVPASAATNGSAGAAGEDESAAAPVPVSSNVSKPKAKEQSVPVDETDAEVEDASAKHSAAAAPAHAKTAKKEKIVVKMYLERLRKAFATVHWYAFPLHFVIDTLAAIFSFAKGAQHIRCTEFIFIRPLFAAL